MRGMVVSPDPGLSAPANRILLVLGQTPFPVELLDGKCRVLYCNIAYAELFLGSKTAVLDLPSRVFPELLPDGRPRQSVLHQAARQGLWKGEVTVATSDGTPIPVRLSVFPIQHPSDAQLEFAVFYENIQQEVETRQALVHQQNLVAIRSRQAQMGELLSMIAHQWRQPLTVVGSLIGNIQLKAQLGGVEPEYLAAKLEKMNQTVQFLSETIDSFRNFYMPSKFKAGEDLVVLSRRALELLLPSLQKLGADVVTDFPGNLMARVFSGEFLQVVLELLTNARDALLTAGASSPTVKFSVFQDDQTGVIRVSNNGGEIPANVLPHIYDPYYTTKEGTAGTGLGLYMAKLIVEAHHGGTLTARCHEGWTEFVCRFPLDGSP
jgi:signal transduction histidine kinase